MKAKTRMRTKNLTALLLTAALSLGLTACKSGTPDDGIDPNPDIVFGLHEFRCECGEPGFSCQELVVFADGRVCAEAQLLYLVDFLVSDLTGIEQFTELRVLNLNDNQITDITPLGSLTKVTYLYLSGNNITDISPLSSLTELSWLELNENFITDLSPLSTLIDLEWLDLGDNFATDISALAPLTKLSLLSLFNNDLTDISPISGLTEIEILDLAYNHISDVSALAPLTELFTLFISDNQITDISMLYFPEMKIFDEDDEEEVVPVIDLSNNPIPQEQVDEIRERHPEANIFFNDYDSQEEE